MDPLPEVWGWGTILQTPTPKKHPGELWDRSVGSRAPGIPFARDGHYWGCPWKPPEGMRFDTVLLVVHIWGLESPCQRDTARVTPRTLCLSCLGCTGILLPRVPHFKGQDWGGCFSWGCTQEGFGVQPKTMFLEVLPPARHGMQRPRDREAGPGTFSPGTQGMCGSLVHSLCRALCPQDRALNMRALTFLSLISPGMVP